MSVQRALFVVGAALLCACGSQTSGPAPLAPAGWTVIAGASQSLEALQALQYYPQSIAIDAGDSVSWMFPTGEPHTVTLLGPRSTAPSPNDPGNPVPAGPLTYDGSTYVSSGFQLLGKSYTLTFPKPGTYTYQCLIHPGMRGTVTVAAQGTAHTVDQSTYTDQAKTQSAADLATAAQSLSAFPYVTGGAHVAAGMAPGLAAGMPSSVTVLRFLDGPSLTDSTVTINAGQIVTWTNQSNNEPHTVTIAPVGAVFPTLAPTAPASGGNVYDGTTLVNSGVLAPNQTFSLQFTKPGVYTYHCLFHDDTEHMIGTVIVQ